MRRTYEVPNYGLLYFDHLRGERFETEEVNPEDKEELLRIEERRNNRELTWDDIYSYQLILLKYQNAETLKSKIISLRLKYQSLVSIADYNNYMTMRAVKDIRKINDSNEELEILRADYKYLLDEFYLRYAYASSHEELRTKLLRWGAICTLIFLFSAVLIGTIPMMYEGGLIPFKSLANLTMKLKDYFATLFVVIFAGIMGAFVSMQQRLQSSTNQGDPIYNLSLLTHGWFSIFLSPISGAIFAALLYLFFAGGLLKGSIFPVMTDYSAGKVAARTKLKNSSPTTTSPTPLPSASPSPDNSPVPCIPQPTPASSSPQPTPTPRPVSSPVQPTPTPTPLCVQPTATPTVSAQPTPTSDSTNAEAPTVGITDFSLETGPEDGKAFALLIIWSFIAGFAERFVPDTLMRLVNQKKMGEANSA